MVEIQDFREDLYYRLRVVEIVLPALRERMDDLLELAEFLIAKAAAASSREPPVLGRDAQDALLAYDWPGNVRELENCLARAVVLAPGDVLRRQDMLLGSSPPGTTKEPTTLVEVEREHVLKVLGTTGGNKTRAAEILGISRPRQRRIVSRAEPEK